MTEIMPTWVLGDLDLTSYPYAIAFGGDHGAPETIVELMQSLLADGDLATVSRHGNREVSLVVMTEGSDFVALAEAEAALRNECTKVRNELHFTPGDGFGPTSVFEVLVAEMRHARDDDQESNLLRRWELTLTCAPFAMSLDTVTISGIPAGTTSVLVDACDSATGWTGTRQGANFAPSTAWEAGSVGVAELDSLVTAPETWTMTRTGSVDFTSTPFLVVEVRTIASDSEASPLNFAASADGVALRKVSVELLSTGSHYRVTFDATPVDVVSSLKFTHVSTSGHPWQGMFVRQINRTDIPPGLSSRELSRIIEVGGTERTPASVHAYTTSGFLGVTLVHTTPHDDSGYAPGMRRWRSSGNTVTPNVDARKITGSWELMRPNPVVSRTPAHSMPRGDYLLVAAIKVDTPTTDTPHPIDWAIKSVISGQTLGEDTGRGYGWFPVAHQLTIVPIASVAAPIVRSGALDVEVHLLNPTGTLAMSVEQWWMFRDDEDSALSIVNTSEGNLWLDSPDVASPVPGIWVGPSKNVAFHPAAGLIAPGVHTFKPGPVLLTTVSDSNDYLTADLTIRERWHSNAAR